jgi:predicted transglutaminase-like cysteine proteinase
MHCRTGTAAIVVALAALALSWSAMPAAAASSHMTVTGRTTQPIGHYEYCRTYAEDCQIAGDGRAVQLTRARWDEILIVNDRVNAAVRPVTDMDYYKVEEYWTYPEKYGDCEDYALAKRGMLIAQGWPASALLITVVRQPNGEGHAVLTVRTDRADYVLDNLNARVLPWNETEYRYLKRQSSRNSGQWEGIEDQRVPIVGSVKK